MANDSAQGPLDPSKVHEAYAGSNQGDTGSVDSAFVPSAVIEPVESNFTPPVTQLAANEDLVAKTLGQARVYKERYDSDREELDTLWADIDYMWKCAKNNSKRRTKTNKNDSNNESSTHASTGSTIFFRQVTRLTAQTMSVYMQKEDPFVYVPIYSTGYFMKESEGKDNADQLNALARWTRDQDDFEHKFINATTLLNKYGNKPLFVRWRKKYAKRKEKRPIYSESLSPEQPPQVIGFTFEDVETCVENYPSLEGCDIQNFWADRHIGDIQKQNCVIYRTLVNYCDLYSMARAGQIANVDKVSSSHLYQGEYDTDQHSTRQENADLNPGDDTQTGLFEMWDVHIRLPISEDGTWNAQANEPKIYWATFVGDIRGNAVCVRLERNPDPDDEIPYMMWHQLPDDEDSLYHLSAAQVIQSNYDELTTAKNQLIDNRTLQNRKPLKGIRGQVYSSDLRFGQHKVIWMETQDSLQEMQISDITGNVQTNIDYIETDSNRALSTDRPIEGVPLGQRTSASEAVNVFEQAKLPHMLNARYQLGQILKWYGKKINRYWQLYADPAQVVELTGENLHKEIKPSRIWGDYEVRVDVINDAANDTMRQQSLNYAIQVLLQIPQFATAIEPTEFLKEWFSMNKWPNASRFLKEPKDFDAGRVARMENMLMVESQMPSYVPPDPGENITAHLKEHEAYRMQFDNIEGAYEQYPGLPLLDQHIAETKFNRDQASGGAGQVVPQQMGAPPMNQTPGEVTGNAMAATMGASVA